MSAMVRFIHAADIHLGYVPQTTGRPPNSILELVKQATFSAFNRICDAAKKYEVDFVVLSGDVYDSEFRSVKANQIFVKNSRKLQEENIPVYIVAGNHDPMKDKTEAELFELPGNVNLFDSESVEIKEVRGKDNKLVARVLGQSYRGRSEARKMYSSFTPPDSGVVNIGLLHTQLDPYNNNYVPCSMDDLMAKGDIHYWALGHIHQCRILNSGRPCIAYPGCPQGKDFGEQGVGGCLLVEAGTETMPVIRFIPTSPLVWRKVQVPIDSDPDNLPQNLDDIKNLLIDQAEKILTEDIQLPENLDTPPDFSFDFFEGYIVQFILTGRGEIHDRLVQDDEVDEILMRELQDCFKDRKPFLWTDSVVLRTGKPLPGLVEFKKESGVAAELEKIVEMCFKDREFKKNLQKELGEIWETRVDHEKINEYKFQLDDETYNVLIDQAVKLVIEKLMERRDNF